MAFSLILFKRMRDVGNIMKKIMLSLILVLILIGCKSKEIELTFIEKYGTLKNQVVRVEEKDHDIYFDFLKLNKVMVPTNGLIYIDFEKIRNVEILLLEDGSVSISHQYHSTLSDGYYIQLNIYLDSKKTIPTNSEIFDYNGQQYAYRYVEDTRRLHYTSIQFINGSIFYEVRTSYMNPSIASGLEYFGETNGINLKLSKIALLEIVDTMVDTNDLELNKK